MTTVATITEAKQRLLDYGVHSIDYKDAECECGLTTCVVGRDLQYNMIASITVCDLCGDDDAWNDEVLTTYKQLA